MMMIMMMMMPPPAAAQNNVDITVASISGADWRTVSFFQFALSTSICDAFLTNTHGHRKGHLQASFWARRSRNLQPSNPLLNIYLLVGEYCWLCSVALIFTHSPLGWNVWWFFVVHQHWGWTFSMSWSWTNIKNCFWFLLISERSTGDASCRVLICFDHTAGRIFMDFGSHVFHDYHPDGGSWRWQNSFSWDHTIICIYVYIYNIIYTYTHVHADIVIVICIYIYINIYNL